MASLNLSAYKPSVGQPVASAPISNAFTAIETAVTAPITNADLSGGHPQLTAWSVLCSAPLTLSTSPQDVPGCSVTLQAGSYLIWAVFYMQHTVNGGGSAVGSLAGAGAGQQAILKNTGGPNGDAATVAAVYPITLGAPTTVKLQASKTIGAGTVIVGATHTSLAYLRIA